VLRGAKPTTDARRGQHSMIRGLVLPITFVRY
jgi:hypothetical protein